MKGVAGRVGKWALMGQGQWGRVETATGVWGGAEA